MQLSLTSLLAVLSLGAPLAAAQQSVSVCINLDITTPSASGDFSAQQDFAIDVISTINDGISTSEFGALTFGTPVTRISTAPDLFADAGTTIDDISNAVIDGGRFRTTNSAILACTRFLTRQAVNEQLVMVTVTDGPTFRNIPLTNEVAQARENNIALVGVTVGDDNVPGLDEFTDEGLGFAVGSFADLSVIGPTVGQSILNAIAGGSGAGSPPIEEAPVEDPPVEEPPVQEPPPEEDNTITITVTGSDTQTAGGDAPPEEPEVSGDPQISVCIALDTTTPVDDADFAAQQEFATSLIDSIDMSLPAEYSAITFGAAVRRITDAPIFDSADGAIETIDTHVPEGGNFRSLSGAVLVCRRDFGRQAAATTGQQFVVSVTAGEAFRARSLPRVVRRARNRDGIQFVSVGVGSDAEETAGILSDVGLTFQIGDFSQLAALGPAVAAAVLEAAA